uniref:Uncharacterized protein n=1 Tax=Anopheles farauti TaxID=69004 RepID=A0A182QWK3_9DIPT
MARTVAKARIDTRAPLMFVENVLKTSKMVRDVERQREVERENKELLKRINYIYRTKGYLNVDYGYRVHQSFHTDARFRLGREIERKNLAFLNRLLNRKATVDSNLARSAGRKTPRWMQSPAAPANDGRAHLRIDFWERTDRRLCQLTIELCPEVSLGEVTLARGKLFRIYQGVMVVIRGGKNSSKEDFPLRHEGTTMERVERGSLVRLMQDGREYFLFVLRPIGLMEGGRLVGRVVPSSLARLDLIDSYGSKFGRCKEPIYFDKIGS